MTPEEWALVVDTIGASEAVALHRAMETAKRMFHYPPCSASNGTDAIAEWDDQGCYFDRSTL